MLKKTWEINGAVGGIPLIWIHYHKIKEPPKMDLFMMNYFHFEIMELIECYMVNGSADKLYSPPPI